MIKRKISLLYFKKRSLELNKLNDLVKFQIWAHNIYILNLQLFVDVNKWISHCRSIFSIIRHQWWYLPRSIPLLLSIYTFTKGKESDSTITLLQPLKILHAFPKSIWTAHASTKKLIWITRYSRVSPKNKSLSLFFLVWWKKLNKGLINTHKQHVLNLLLGEERFPGTFMFWYSTILVLVRTQHYPILIDANDIDMLYPHRNLTLFLLGLKSVRCNEEANW